MSKKRWKHKKEKSKKVRRKNKIIEKGRGE